MKKNAEKTPTYTMIGIYDKGEICVTQDLTTVFFCDEADTFALIREIHGEPIREWTLTPGMKVYNVNDIDWDRGPITEFSTWQAIVESGFADDIKDDEDNVLRYVLTTKHAIHPAVFDYLYAEYPETDISDILYLCERLAAVKWACDHGADKNYDGLRIPLKDYIANSHAYEAAEIFQYLYGCSRETYLKSLKGS